MKQLEFKKFHSQQELNQNAAMFEDEESLIKNKYLTAAVIEVGTILFPSHYMTGSLRLLPKYHLEDNSQLFDEKFTESTNSFDLSNLDDRKLYYDPSENIEENLSIFYKKLKSVIDRINCNKMNNSSYIKVVKDFLKFYKKSLREQIIADLSIKTNEQALMQQALNCLSISINIVNLLIDRVNKSIMKTLIECIKDFHKFMEQNPIRRICELILYCLCNYCNLFISTQKNAEINRFDIFEELFENSKNKKIIISSAIILCHNKSLENKMKSKIRNYLQNIYDSFIEKSVDRYYGIKLTLINESIIKLDLESGP